MSIRFQKSAWSDVNVAHIKLFQKSGFEDNSVEYGLGPNGEFDEDDDVPLALYAQRFNGSFEDIVCVDDNMKIVETRSKDDTVNDILGSNSESIGADSDNDNEVVELTDLPNPDNGTSLYSVVDAMSGKKCICVKQKSSYTPVKQNSQNLTITLTWHNARDKNWIMSRSHVHLSMFVNLIYFHCLPQ